MLNPVATTGLLVAAMRAEESERAERLFEDPFAARLAGPTGRAELVRYRAALGLPVPIIEVRTRYYDIALMRAHDAPIRQFVLLAAGMDTRAYRLPLASDARVFELDQPAVLEAKARELDGVRARCQRRAVPCDLATDWASALEQSGFDRTAKTAWLVEGVLQYLDAALVERLFARIDALSVPGSSLHYDVVGQALLHLPMFEPLLRYMRELGAPWIYASDDPATPLAGRDWDVQPSDPGELGRSWQRWPLPAAAAGRPGPGMGAFVEAKKRAGPA
jgi:methyltransferase (TIGR00027 family)